MNETGNDSSSEDDDYKPSKKEIMEADADDRKQKRKVASDGERMLRQAKMDGKHLHDEAKHLHLGQAAKTNAKVSDLWQQLKGSTGSTKTGSVNVVSLCNSGSNRSISAADREWMRQLGIASYKPAAQQSFLGASKSQAQQNGSSHTMPVISQEAASPKAIDRDAAARALAAAKSAVSASEANAEGEISVLETRRFAGKNIQVSKTATQEEAEKLKERDSKKSGIDAVLASLQAAKKVNVLDKSRDDWGQFKKTDAEIEQELDAYKKSGGKYLDKVDFLKRTELREYEAERDQRLAGDIRSRGRM